MACTSRRFAAARLIASAGSARRSYNSGVDARISFQRALASTDSGLQPAAAGYSVSAYTSSPSAAANRSRIDAPATSGPVTPASFSTDGATSVSDTGAAMRRAASPGAATTSGTLSVAS